MTEQFTILYTPSGRMLRVEGQLPNGLHGETIDGVYLCPTDEANAAAIRQILPWSAPQRVGLKKSVGCGDRLGIATPGQLRAVQEGDMFPVLAQQSMREMERARRSPQQVLDDATWGVIAANYQDGFACDADHLKTIEDINVCADAGYIGYTLDPGQYVDDEADHAEESALENKIAALPWDVLQTTPAAHRAYFLEKNLSELEYLRAAAKYGGALAHVARLHQHLIQRLGRGGYDLEVSVDETASVTTLAQHRFIALELQRLNVEFIGLAPRFPGDFEKGVDYIGDLAAFEEAYQQHAALARELGDYKLSIHSGSKVHLKTAGTSWVEALRVIAVKAPDLFQKILALAIEGYPQNRASYHVSARVENIPQADTITSLPDQFDAREVLHVSFGPVLAAFRQEIYTVLIDNLETYWDILHTHFQKHIQPFGG
ncbi:MAG: tagaturonate epimerase family protein [Anaerolineae bacterium]|nr:tagaturonate epimerase family protein [Anaerolineae bacterium]